MFSSSKYSSGVRLVESDRGLVSFEGIEGKKKPLGLTIFHIPLRFASSSYMFPVTDRFPCCLDGKRKRGRGKGRGSLWPSRLFLLVGNKKPFGLGMLKLPPAFEINKL